jgi:hypothetical protein
MGRSTAFNATLFFTSLFGLLASLANSFFTLCVLLFFLGSAVGVSTSHRPLFQSLMYEHHKGFNANRRHTPPRTHAKGKTIPCHRPLRLLLIWRSPICRRRPPSYSTTLLRNFLARM